MGTIVVPDENKIGKEQLLLGDVKVAVRDCNGEEVEIHGLTANDLIMKSLDSNIPSMPLAEYIEFYAGITPDLTSGFVINSRGEKVSMVSIADSIDEVEFEIEDLQEKYDELAD